MTDRMTQLEDDILLSILYSLTMKEAARMSLLSHKWNTLWRYFRLLVFEDLTALDRIYPEMDPNSASYFKWRNHTCCTYSAKYKQNVELLEEERLLFVSRVNNVVEKHVGLIIDELRITYDLNISHQCFVDRWVNFALAKQVKKLELDFTPFIRYGEKDAHDFCVLCLQEFPKSLTSLCLRYVDITSETVARVFLSCPFLDNLCIEYSKTLTNITSPSDLALPLKYLEVNKCPEMEAIDICAPELLSFEYCGHPIDELHVRNASSLSKVSIGMLSKCYTIRYAFESLSTYFSQLDYLSLSMGQRNELNAGISDIPALPNLKHLELQIWTLGCQTLRGWDSLFKASPGLQKLTFKFWSSGDLDDRNYINFLIGIHDPDEPTAELDKDIKCDGSSLECLKTLELVGFLGHPIDLEIAFFVFQKAIVLEEVIVDAKPPSWEEPHEDCLKSLAAAFEHKLPPSVTLTYKPLS